MKLKSCDGGWKFFMAEVIESAGDDDDTVSRRRRVLSEVPPETVESIEASASAPADSNGEDMEEIKKELRRIRKQNLITHFLLASMIAVTLTWQASEVSIALKIKQTLTHPFRSIAGTLKSFFLAKTRPAVERIKNKQPPSSFPDLIKIPPTLELPSLDLNDED
ncbi:hypothetical protein M569_11977 [Genlisea aurea]|uniref:Uncharacterized protein n=1 Tax=Genlisea aurea TaxID=192259 RepID=S8C7P3_9LAMI|nr:hypothetical protein M569_11977 [Genlisea aurea]